MQCPVCGNTQTRAGLELHVNECLDGAGAGAGAGREKKKRRKDAPLRQMLLSSSGAPGRLRVDGAEARGKDISEFGPFRLVRHVLEEEDALLLLEETLALAKEKEWKPETSEVFGRVVQTSRVTAELPASQWSVLVRRAAACCSRALGIPRWEANRCIVNIYPDGDATVGSHSDRLDYLGPHPAIAGLSLGATRVFSLVHQTSRQRVSQELPHNSLVVMGPGCQEHWKHEVRKGVVLQHARHGPLRVSYTFRMAYEDLDKPQCPCGEAAMLKCVQKAAEEGKTHFWYCVKNSYQRVGEEPCEFFQWFDWEAWKMIRRY